MIWIRLKLIEILEEQQRLCDSNLATNKINGVNDYLYGKVVATKEIIAVVKLVLEVKDNGTTLP